MPQKYSTPVYRREVPARVYDGLIAIGILTSATGLFFVPWLFWLPLAVLVWGSFVEPRILTKRHFVVGEGSHKLRIVFLSDIHVGPYKGSRWISYLVKRTNALNPDLILLGGDFIYDALSDPAPLKKLAGLQAKHGVIGIMGNHDFHYSKEDEIEKILQTAGITLLRNASTGFTREGVHYVVTGVEDDWGGDTNFEKANREIVKGDCTIALIHNPDLAPYAAKFRPALMLSGHVHGGQIRLPFIGAVPPLPHHLGRKYDRGLFGFSDIPLIIGQGVGESGPRARLFCPPQIVEVELRH